MTLHDALKAALHAVNTLLSLANRIRNLLSRLSSAPGLPVPHPTEPYWLSDPPHAEARDALPATADIVIIGSGIAAAATVHALLELEPDLRVVVLEARRLCSGATGRNGGHVKVVPYHELSRLALRFGHQTARRLVRFQLMHLPALLRLGARYPEAEVREVETSDFFVDVQDWHAAQREVEAMRPWLPDTGAGPVIAGAVSYTAGALWPYRLVTSVWHELRSRHAATLSICTQTPVEAVEKNDCSLLVRCKSGSTITARHVVHATNAYAGQLVPLLRRRLTGVLGHMTAQRPGPTFPADAHGRRSWSVIYPSSEGFDYATQRPDRADGSPGDVLLGGGLFRSLDGGLDQMGVWDDSRLDPLPLMHLRGSLSAIFQPESSASAEPGATWSGIMGFTGDGLPLVGRLPDHQTRTNKRKKKTTDGRQWVIAGFNGEGMVWAWLSGAALAVMLAGRENEALPPGEGGRPGGKLAEWFPGEELAVDKARLRRAELRNLAGLVMA
ncbi:hypothetical protein CDD80_7478 [Ophiocordyceps camponoti-rufipedis]|uniref:FAD dependent oxidoreductase domain-containing protein n=1 Tax=Ophiocordyceps camponoti-rufipedis TaxID=2004952 RepID=A0A2C5ZDB3_9HYPO|nr:hypothetical protein CDD80_7478 [Ophiocordyceps camponoti-rufipedis]